jgi:hypothetical protein
MRRWSLIALAFPHPNSYRSTEPLHSGQHAEVARAGRRDWPGSKAKGRAGFEEAMPTFGNTLLLTILHQMVYNGQIAHARRVAGRKPLL